MNKIFNSKEKQISYLIFVITMIVAICPLITRYCINGHDLEYHLLRIESLKEGILIGKPFLKVNTLFFGNAGYASSLFYSDLFIYIPALLRVCGVSIGASYHIFLIIMFALNYSTVYYCVLKMSKSRYTAIIAAVLLTLCPYHMDDMLVRAACGEIAAFIFIPLVVYGVYNVIYENMSKPYIFGIGFAGLILSHPATLTFNIGFALVVFLIYIKTFINKPSIILRLVATTFVTLLVTAFQWIPMVEQMISTKFYVSNSDVDMLDAALECHEVFSQNLLACGVVLLVLFLPRIFLNKKDYPALAYADVLALLGFVYAIGTTKIIPWGRLQRILSFVQFPWRLLIMSSVLLAVADAIIIVVFVDKYLNNRIEPVICLILAVCVCLSIEHYENNMTGYYDYSDDYFSYEPFTANVIGGEWLPASVTDRDSLVELSHYMVDDNGVPIDFNRERGEIYADIESLHEYVDVPFIYYKGYEAVIDTADQGSLSLLVDGSGYNGMTRVYTSGACGKLRVWYKGTSASKLAGAISIASIIGIVFVCLYRRKRAK